jgi:hypothetical protein
MRVIIFLFGFLCMCSTCLSAQNQDCRTIPVFVGQSKLDYKRIYFSTSERTTMGLVLMESPLVATDPPRKWQHPSWNKAGWLGPMLITNNGDIWVAPVPVINLLHNKPDDQNTLWRTDPATGELKPQIVLPKPDSNFNGQNPYGVLGLAFDCDNSILYASSVAGSTRRAELGHIYAISTRDNKVLHVIDSTDAFGIGVATVAGVKKLYFGHARNGHIGSIELLPDGGFGKRTEQELTLDNLGPRGDDRARKIRVQPDGSLTVTGIEFYFNLTAPTEKQESTYRFAYNQQAKQWILVEMK